VGVDGGDVVGGPTPLCGSKPQPQGGSGCGRSPRSVPRPTPPRNPPASPAAALTADGAKLHPDSDAPCAPAPA
jgi:hypothetical protein